MSRWEEHSIKNDFNEAAKEKEVELDKPDDPEPKPTYQPAGPAPGGSSAPAFDRHQAQRSQDVQKSQDPEKSRTVTEEFNKKAK
ncbi:hypothetical protein [uncultured Roseobacter sp.]|uniref:hypothetical protein n=1 Tax=uncultured Roseobacter sp. TaxID=114847 RepID=UPI0026215856|nr:hypothetical protein [uncultured Roseobacter sp.]